MRFQSFLSLITYLAIGILSLTVWTKKSEARIGCSYREINNLEKMVSEETAKKIDIEVKNIVDKGYARARKILTEKIDDIHKL